MLFAQHLVVIRGGGDLGTGVAYRLHQAGFPIIVLELENPLTIRRTVAVSSAVEDGVITVEGMLSRRTDSAEESVDAASQGHVAVLVADSLPDLGGSVVVDARLAKRNIDTALDQAPLVVGLGPGFTAGGDCHAVVETMRGHHLGRVIWKGGASPDTGVPGVVGGRAGERVVRASRSGQVTWSVAIGDRVSADQALGAVDDEPIRASLDGVVRGLIRAGYHVGKGLKIADIDPRNDPSACWEISDKALAVGGGALEAVLTWLNRQ